MTKTNLKERQDTPILKGEMFIESIQLKEDRAIIKFAADDEFKTTKSTYNVKDEVTRKFKQLWNKTLGLFLDLVPIFKSEVLACTLNSLKFEYDAAGYLSSVIFSVIYKFGNDTEIININTPKIHIYDDMPTQIPQDDIELLYELIQAAKAYMKGDTANPQTKLNLIVNNEE